MLKLFIKILGMAEIDYAGLWNVHRMTEYNIFSKQHLNVWDYTIHKLT